MKYGILYVLDYREIVPKSVLRPYIVFLDLHSRTISGAEAYVNRLFSDMNSMASGVYHKVVRVSQVNDDGSTVTGHLWSILPDELNGNKLRFLATRLVCVECGVTGKMPYGSAVIVRDFPYRDVRYACCPGTVRLEAEPIKL